MFEFSQVLLLLQQMCVYLVIAYLLSKTPLFIPLTQVTIRLPHKLLCYVIFSVFCIMGTYFGLHVEGSIANTRAIGAVLGGLLGGPSVGLLVALTGGLHRYTLGGMTDIACAVSTVAEGLVGGLVHSIAMRHRRIDLLFNPLFVAGVALVTEVLQMVIILAIARPFDEALRLVEHIALPMLIANTLGAAMFMDALGLSMALGTFIAGVLLAESEYRHELEISIEPFKGLLLGLFFISVGMALNIGVLYTHLAEVLLGVVVLVAIKSGVLYSLSRIFGLRSSVRLQFAGVLSQGGEFAFVLFSAAGTQKVLHSDQLALLLVVVTLSMMTTPLLMQIIDRILVRRYNARDEDEETPYVEDDDPQVIIVGFGRFGQVIGRLLMANKMRITVLERDVSAVGVLRRYGYKVYYGDATELELLRAAGAAKARSIVITCNEPEDTMEIVRLCQQHFPDLSILARARGRVEAHELLQAGVKQFSRETFSSALELGRKALMELGMHPHQAYRGQQHYRRLDMRMLRELMPPHHGDVAQISRVKEARRELEELFHREMQKESRQFDGWDEYE